MRIEFFPSRTLTLYLARLFVTRILAVLIMLVLILQTLDLLGQSGDILAYKGNGQPEILRYISLRAPQIAAFFMPYAVLLATIITLFTLNQNSEVISMKAAGMSAYQVLAPLIMVGLVVSALTFVFNEHVVTRSYATLKAWQAVDYGPVPRDSGTRDNVYMRDGANILVAGTVTGASDDTLMENVSWYRRDANGRIVEQVRGPRARWANPGWRIEQPVSFDVASTTVKPLGDTVVAPQLGPKEVAITTVDADRQSVFQLTRSIDEMKASGRRTTKLEAAWWHKFSGPLSAALMPLLGAVAAFGLARSGQLLVRAIIGMALGFAYFVLDNAAMAMGDFGGYPPLIAAWAPFLLFLLIGQTVLVRTEE